MDSYYFTPAQRFYSAARTAELLASTHGEISLTNNDSKIKIEYFFLGALILGTVLAVAVIKISDNEKKTKRILGY